MPDEDRRREAPVHFELYRLLKNNINEYHSISIQYKSVKPEYPAKNGAIDLVVEAEVDHEIRRFLAIEVKKQTMRSYLLFETESLQQVEGYAESLDSRYFILTDGDVLRLFNKDRYLIGNYRFGLTDNYVKRLLTDLLELNDGKLQTLNFPAAPPIDKEEIAKERDWLVRALIEVLEQLGKEKEFKLESRKTERNHLRYLTVGSSKKVFSMGIEREKRDISKDQSYIYLQLSDLRTKLGMETLHELLVKLGQIPAFTWVDPNVANRNDQSTWKNVKYIPFDGDLKLNSMKKQLLEWFLDLSGRLRTPT